MSKLSFDNTGGVIGRFRLFCWYLHSQRESRKILLLRPS